MKKIKAWVIILMNGDVALNKDGTPILFLEKLTDGLTFKFIEVEIRPVKRRKK